jgi:outer membrane cobalamin receptor
MVPLCTPSGRSPRLDLSHPRTVAPRTFAPSRPRTPDLAPSRPRTPHLAPSHRRTVVVFVAALLCCAAPAMAATVRGRVVDPDGRPVARARVLVAAPLGVRAAETDADGRFEIADLSAAVHTVTVNRPGFAVEPLRLTLAPDEVRELTISLHVAAVSESVVVSAAQVPEPLSEATASITVVGAGEIRARQLEGVSDALRTVTGLAVARSGGRGALTSVFPRGGESDYTLVLVDGLRVNSFGGFFDFSLLPFGDVERVEVVRGPQSALFGSDAIGGVVQVITKSAESPFSAQAFFEGGNDDSTHLLGAVRGRKGAWGWRASGERSASDGFTGTASTGERVSNDDFEMGLASAGLSWDHGADVGVRLDGRWLTQEKGVPGPYGSNPLGIYTAVDRLSRGDNDEAQFGARGYFPWSSRLRGRVRQQLEFAYSDLDSGFVSPFGTSNFETRRIGGRFQTDAVLRRATGLSAGVEIQSERALSTFVTGEQFQEIPIERRVIGTFAELRQDVGTSVALAAGVRVESIHQDGLEGSPGVRPAFGSDTVFSTNPKVAVSWVAWRSGQGAARTRLRASAGTGIRPPDAFEIAFTDNPGLKPERSRSFDVGVTQLLIDGAVTLEATWFANRYDDLIVAVGPAFENASRYQTDNISNARARGLELGAAWRTAWGLSARAGYTWLQTRILAVDDSPAAPPPFAVGDPLLRRPENSAFAGVIVERGRMTAFLDVYGRGETLDIEPSFGASTGLFTSEGYVVANTGATVTLGRGIQIFGRVLNLFDREYEEVYGFPAPGRSGMVGVRVALGQ